MSRGKHDRGRRARVIGEPPPSSDDAPPVPGTKPGERVLGSRRDQVVPGLEACYRIKGEGDLHLVEWSQLRKRGGAGEVVFGMWPRAVKRIAKCATRV